ncbi:MAG TPA: alpha/beta hydrolase [Mycobacteriales bacterium]|jgi:pimeloyl-ACP methyl ester carboxylesterase|nr:alpha/beta hydrolase [Mycobacteriales bacterium]
MSLPLPPLEGVTHRYVRVGGLDVHVAEAGEGEPLVLLHGWPQHWWVWRHVVPLLARDYRLVMPDLRGHGWTGAPATGYDKEQLALDLLGLLEAMDLPEVGLVGHDWGGWVGFLACLRAPKRFRGFVPLSVPHPFQQPDRRLLQTWRGTYQVVLGTPLLGESLLRSSPHAVGTVLRLGTSMKGAITPADAALYARVLQEPARARASSRLYRTFVLAEALPVLLGQYRGQRLRVPTRLVGGADDPVVTPALLGGYELAADDMQVEVLPGCGHFVPEERPDAVARTVRALLPA